MKKQIYTLKGLNFSYYATTAILLPYLPLYFQSEGFTSSQIGILMMIGPFIAMFAQPLWGYVSDRLSKVKPIIFILWGLTILSSIGLFTTNGLSMAFIFVLLLYFFMMPSVPLLDSITITSTLQAGTTYGTVRSWGSFGFSSIAMVSGYLISQIGGTAHIGILYWALWTFPLLLLFFLQDEKVNGSKITLSSLKIVLQNRSFLWFLFMIFILIIPHRMNDSLFGLYLHHLGASDKWVGWAWALAALSEIPSFAFAGRFVQRFHELALLGVVALLYTVRWLLYGFIDNPFILAFLQLAHSITFAIFWMVSVQYAVRLVPEQFRSTGQSLLSAVFLGLAGITGGYIGGWIQDTWGGSRMYLFGSVLTFIAAIMLFSTRIVQRKKGIF